MLEEITLEEITLELNLKYLDLSDSVSHATRVFDNRSSKSSIFSF